MNAHSTAGRLLVGLAVSLLLSACTIGTSPSPVPTTPTPTSLPSEPVATPTPTAAAATASPAATPSVVITASIARESANPVLSPGELDVHAPAEAGPWPVVVMFHGSPGSDPAEDRRGLSELARRVAALGFVVFNASWGHLWERCLRSRASSGVPCRLPEGGGEGLTPGHVTPAT